MLHADTMRRLIENRSSRRHALHGAGIAGLAAALSGGVPSLLPAAHAQSTPAASPAATPALTMIEVNGVQMDAETLDNVANVLWLDAWDETKVPADTVTAVIAAKNRGDAFAERMLTRLQALIDQPESFVPSYATRYDAFADVIRATGTQSAHQAYALSAMLGPDASHDFNPLPKPVFDFPKRHAVDLTQQLGWYFVVGSCTDVEGQEYGVEVMLFRNTILPPPIAEQYGITDVENQVTELHFAVTVAGDAHHRSVPFVVAGTTGLLAFTPDKLGWRMGENAIETLDAAGPFPLHVTARGVNRSGETPLTFAVDFVCATGGEPTFQGEEGCKPCCDGIGTLYYSIPQMRLDPERSTLTIGDRTVKLASGRFWLDHQWGTDFGASPKTAVTRAVGNLSAPVTIGWDWFMAQFDEGHAISGESMHTDENIAFFYQTGDTPPGTMTAPINARFMTGDGGETFIKGSVEVDAWVKSTSSPDPARYTPSNTWYPNRWTYTFGDDIPEAFRHFTMTPIVSTGQSGFFANGAQYSEGAVVLHDADGAEIGRGFAESVNYADTLETRFSLAGLPATPELLATMQRPLPSRELIAESQGYVLLHQAELKKVIAACIGLDA